jgi:hypothetical protein
VPRGDSAHRHADELHEVVDRRVDPSTALREQDLELVGRNCPALGLCAIPSGCPPVTNGLAGARGKNIILRAGKVRIMRVERKRSSPSSRRFFWCKVVTTLWLYSRVISDWVRIGTQSESLSCARLRSEIGPARRVARRTLRALSRYIEKQPGRQVTPPKTDSKALATVREASAC